MVRNLVGRQRMRGGCVRSSGGDKGDNVFIDETAFLATSQKRMVPRSSRIAVAHLQITVTLVMAVRRDRAHKRRHTPATSANTTSANTTARQARPQRPASARPKARCPWPPYERCNDCDAG